MKILILGAKGSLGQAFSSLFKDAVAFGHQQLDITDQSAVNLKITELKPDVVINCAAFTSVDKSEQDFEKARLVNAEAVRFISKACKKSGAILVHFSSAAVFDGNNPQGCSEDRQTKPANAYGRSKAEGENLLLANCEKFYLVRTMWLYGRQSSENGKKSFVELMLEKAKQNQPIELVNDEFGQPTYVLDLAKNVKNLLVDKAPFGIYHLANSGLASWFDWATEVFKIKNIKHELIAVSRDQFSRVANRPKFNVFINTKTEQLRDWREALRDYLNQNGQI